MSRHNYHLPWPDYVQTLKPHERPVIPGSPATPDHSLPYRIAYFCVGLLVGLTGGIGSAMISTNTQYLAGDLGVSLTEAAWLPVVFVMTSACMNLLLVKFRMQYGLRLFAMIFLGFYLAIAVANLFYADYVSTLILRLFAGMASAALTTLGFLYLIQSFPAPHRIKAIIVAIGISSFSLPLVRLFSNPLLELTGWHGVHLFELGLALMSLIAVMALKTPPSERLVSFERMDFVTFSLFASGIALICAVLGLGRLVWWTEATWIGLALIGAIVLLTLALVIEHRRTNPLINLRWLAGKDMLRLAVSLLLVRICLSEQTVGAIGLLQIMGQGPEQMHGLFLVMFISTLAGVGVCAFVLKPSNLNALIALSLFLIAAGAFMDAQSTALTRPAQLYVSQALIAFAAALFLAPAMLMGLGQVIRQGAKNMVSFIVLFSLTQNLAGLAGSALIGSIEQVRMSHHLSHLTESLNRGDPELVLRLNQLAGAYAARVTDAAALKGAALGLFNQQLTLQAHVLAYNDVFFYLGVASLGGGLWITYHHLKPWLAQRLAARQAEKGAG